MSNQLTDEQFESLCRDFPNWEVTVNTTTAKKWLAEWNTKVSFSDDPIFLIARYMPSILPAYPAGYGPVIVECAPPGVLTLDATLESMRETMTQAQADYRPPGP